MNNYHQQLRDEINLRGYSDKTLQSYTYVFKKLSEYFDIPIETLTDAQLQSYFLYLNTDKHSSRATILLHLNGVHFFFQHVLHRTFNIDICLPKAHQKIPELLTRNEVLSILQQCKNERDRTMLSTCYACGLRVSELTNLKLNDIDGERCLLKICQGKGGKDRLIILPPLVLNSLRLYWTHYKPAQWLFCSHYFDAEHPLHGSTIRKIFNEAVKQAGITKKCSLHSLRHAYATHQLESGMPINQLQHQLGHSDIKTTEKYLHWLPELGHGSCDLLASLGLPPWSTKST